MPGRCARVFCVHDHRGRKLEGGVDHRAFGRHLDLLPADESDAVDGILVVARTLGEPVEGGQIQGAVFEFVEGFGGGKDQGLLLRQNGYVDGGGAQVGKGAGSREKRWR